MFALAALSMGSFSLSGCGIPEVAPLMSHDEKADLFAAVIRGVQCEIRHAVLKEMQQDSQLRWLQNWTAIINMSLSFKNMAQFNPGATLNTPMIPGNVFFPGGVSVPVPQAYNLGLGGGVSGSMTRKESVEFFVDFHDFLKAPSSSNEVCYRHDGLTIKGDLKLADWLDDALEPVKQCAFDGGPEIEYEGLSTRAAMDMRRRECMVQRNPIRTLSHKIDFDITFTGGVTPTWTLVRVSSPVPASPPLFGVSRADTSELLLTLGPGNDKPKDFKSSARFGRRSVARSRGPSEEVVFRNLTLQFGSEVRQAQ